MYATLIKAGLAVAAFLALTWAGIATYDHVYDAGVAAEHAKTEAVQTKLDAMTDRAVQAEATAKHNETAALALGQSLTDQAAAYDAHDAGAKSDADAYTAALDAARRARCPDVPDPIAEIAEQDQALIAKNAVIADAMPKVEAYDTFLNSEGYYGLQNAARAIGAPPNGFVAWLKADGFLFYQGGSLVPKASFLKLGIFVVRAAVGDLGRRASSRPTA